MIPRSDKSSEYIGRFAPSPTGPLHLGSIMAAYASYCDAMHNNGQWLVRIEDLDPPREKPGASLSIINTLKKFGFQFDKNIIFQSQQNRQNAYQAALEILEKKFAVYNCSCSRAELKGVEVLEHSCRFQSKKPTTEFSVKLKTTDKIICFEDMIQGQICKHLLNDCGDVVLKRKEGFYSYQLAVVVDDFYQGVTHVVRGIDLLDSTPWQIYLNELLGFPQLQYSHIPVFVNNQGQKLSKQTFAQTIENENPIETLLFVHNHLKQQPFIEKPKTLEQFWNHAIQHWSLNNVPKISAIKV